MNQTLEDRMQNVEDELKQLRKEMEESIARYKAVQDGETEEPVGFIPMTSKQWNDHCKKIWEDIKLEN